MDATAHHEKTSNGTFRVPRAWLPYVGVFLLGGGGGFASRFAAPPAQAASVTPEMQQQVDALNRERERAARDLAVLQEQVRAGFTAVRSDLAQLRDEVRELARERRRR